MVEGTEGTDAFTGGNAATAYYRFGLSQLGSEFPVKEFEFTPIWLGGDYDPNYTKLKRSFVSAAIGVIPVNGLNEYLLLARNGTGVANVGDASDGTKTITPILSGKNEPFTIRGASESANTDLWKSNTGMRAKSLMISHDISADRTQPMAHILTALGRRQVASPIQTTSTGLTYPGSKSDEYVWDSDGRFYWDSEGDNVDYKDEYIGASLEISCKNRLSWIDAQTYPNTQHQGDRTMVMTCILHRGKDTSIYDDMIAQAQSTDIDIKWKIHQGSSTYYKQYHMQELRSPKIVRILNQETDDKPATYALQAQVRKLSIEIVDGINKSFYGVA